MFWRLDFYSVWVHSVECQIFQCESHRFSPHAMAAGISTCLLMTLEQLKFVVDGSLKDCTKACTKGITTRP